MVSVWCPTICTCGACGSSTDMTSKQQIVGVQIIFVVNLTNMFRVIYLLTQLRLIDMTIALQLLNNLLPICQYIYKLILRIILN